jgi:hypothetical protein
VLHERPGPSQSVPDGPGRLRAPLTPDGFPRTAKTTEFIANRRAADAYRDQIRSQLAEHGHCRFLDHLEPDPDGGWRLHIFVADEQALSPLADISGGRCGPGDPVNFDHEEFVSEHIVRMGGSDTVRIEPANYTPNG